MNTNIRTSVVVNLIRTITITLLSFVSFPFAAKALGDIGMGFYSFANTFVYYFLIIAKLGIPNLAIRECSKVKDNPVELNRKVQTFFILQLLTTLASFAFLIILTFSLGGPFNDTKMRSLIFLLSINFLVGAFSFEWVYITLEKHFYMAVRSIFTIGFGALLIINFVKSDSQIFIYALLAILSTILTSIVNIVGLKRVGISLKPLGNYQFKQYWKPLLSIAMITIIVTFYNQTDTMIIGFFDSTTSGVGSYAVGIRGIEIVITIITSLSAVFMPRAIHLYKQENKIFFSRLTTYSLNICLFIALPAVMTMILLAPDIVNFMAVDGNEYWTPTGLANARYAVMIVSSLMLTFSIGDIIYSQVLLPMNKEKYYLITMAIGLVLNVSLALLAAAFITPENPMLGAAIVTAAVDLVILVPLLIMTKKYTFRALFNMNTLKLVIAVFIVGVVTLFLARSISLSPLLKIGLILLIDAAIYVTVLLVLRENLVASIFLRKRQKLNEGEN